MSAKRLLLKLAAHAGLAALARATTGAQLRILCYHGLWTTPGFLPGKHMWLRPALFDARMARLRTRGLPVLGLGAAIAALAERRLPRHAVVITIDDGWWSTWTHMLPTLERLRLPATLYATTWYAGRDLPVVNVALDYMRQASRAPQDWGRIRGEIEALPVADRVAALRDVGRAVQIGEDWLETRQFNLMGGYELADAQARGLDIQLHTHRHIDVTTQIDRLSPEIAENRAYLAQAIDPATLVHFCYPSGTWHPRAAAILAESGVRSATLVDEGLNAADADPYRLRRFLDGQTITMAEFDAYLNGVLHYLSAARALAARRRTAFQEAA